MTDTLKNVEVEKPYCVIVPQSVMVIACVALCVFACFVKWWIAVAVAVLLGLCCAVQCIRKVLFGRIVTCVVFVALAMLSCHKIYVSNESWDTAPRMEEDIPAWNGGERRDPGGEKVAYSLLLLCFVALAGMPWLPPGNQYYRSVCN